MKNGKHKYPRVINNKWGKDLKVSVLKKGEKNIFRLRYYAGKHLKYLHRNTESDMDLVIAEMLQKYEEGNIAGGDSSKELLSYYESLLPKGVSLMDTVQYYIDHHTNNDITLKDAITKYLNLKSDLSTPHVTSIKSRLRKLNHLDHKNVSQITVSDLNQVIELYDNRVTKINFKRIYNAFFCWCEKNGYIKRVNGSLVSELMEIPPLSRKDIVEAKENKRVLLPEELEGILNLASQDLKIHMILSGLMGVRCKEATRLQWHHVNFEDNEIWLSQEVTKTPQEREVTMCEQFKKLTSSCKDKTGKIINTSLRALHHERLEICKKLGIDWTSNGLRRSFVSYKSKLKGVTETAEEAGHGVQVLKSVYRRQTTKHNAERWFSVEV